MVSLSLFVGICKPERTDVEGKQSGKAEVKLRFLVTQTMTLSVEMDIHVSVYSTDFYIFLNLACVHVCISGVPMSNTNLLDSGVWTLCLHLGNGFANILANNSTCLFTEWTVLNLFACRSVEICWWYAAFKSRVLNNHWQKWISSYLCFHCHEGYYIYGKVSAVVVLFGRVCLVLFSCHSTSR